VGQLVKDEYFTLFESVGAIEVEFFGHCLQCSFCLNYIEQIMDPKMDTGYLADGETMDDDYDVTGNLLPEELLGIIDQLLCLEVRFSFL
jgi:hypothetical protein